MEVPFSNIATVQPGDHKANAARKVSLGSKCNSGGGGGGGGGASW